MSLPFNEDIIRLRNNNPGNAPDYTESEFITLRRYNGEPLNHTQADDNLELLRRAILGVDANTRYLQTEVTNVQWNENTINDLFNNQFFTENLKRWVVNEGDFITNTIIGGPTFTEFLNEFIEQFFTENFNTYFNEIFVTEEIQEFFDFRTIINEYFESPDTIFNEYLSQFITNINVVEQIDIEELVRRIQTYVDFQINVAISGFQAQLDAINIAIQTILELLDALINPDGDGIDLSPIIEAIQNLAATVQKIADDLGDLADDVAVNTEDILTLQNRLNQIIGHVNKISEQMQKLSAAVKLALAELEKWMNKVFNGLIAAIAALGQQIGNNAIQIADLWAAFGAQAIAVWTQIGELWAEVMGLIATLEGLAARVCENEAEIETINNWLLGLQKETLTVCVDGAASDIDVMGWGDAFEATDPAKLQACGGPEFEALLERLKSEDKAGAVDREKEIQEEQDRDKKRAMRDFNRTPELVSAVEEAREKGFTFPEILDFIHVKYNAGE